MGSSYLVRIADVCSGIADKLMAPSRRGDMPNDQRHAFSRNGANINDIPDKRPSVCRQKAGRDSIQKIGSMRDAWKVDAEGSPSIFEFAAFVRDLDALRKRMIGVSFCDQVCEMSHQIACATEDYSASDHVQDFDGDPASKSMRDAITSAVLLLPDHGMNSR